GRAVERRGSYPGRDGGGGEDDLPAAAGGVAGRHGGADRAPADAASRGEQQRFGEELGADVGFGGAEGAAQADLAAPLEHRDDHHVGDADPADQQGDRAEAEKQRVERGFGGGAGGQHV